MIGNDLSAFTSRLAEDLRDAWALTKVYTAHPKTLKAAELPYAVIDVRATYDEEAATLNHDGFLVTASITLLEKETPRLDWFAAAQARVETFAAIIGVPVYRGLLTPRIQAITLLEAEEEPVVGLEVVVSGVLSVPRT